MKVNLPFTHWLYDDPPSTITVNVLIKDIMVRKRRGGLH